MTGALAPIRLLIVDDAPDDAALVLRELKRSGFDVSYHRVDDEPSLQQAIANGGFDAVICDFNLPKYDAFRALTAVRALLGDVPFIVVSGEVGEETAVTLIKQGANDYVPKQHLGRVPIALERELRERAVRRERADAQERLRVSEERFRFVVQSLEEIVYTLDRDQRIDGVYGRGLETAGLTAELLLGKTPAMLVGATDSGVMAEANARALAGEATRFDWVNGAGRSYSVSLSPLRTSVGVVGVVGVGRDTTAQKRADAHAIVSDRMMSLGTLAAGVAHEINNPLAALHANLGFVQNELTQIMRSPEKPVDDQFAESFAALEDAVEASERVRDIVRDLKLFSRDREGEAMGPVDVAEVTKSSLRMAWNEIRHRARVVKQLSPVPPVLGSASRMGQVVLNLLVNAAQAIPDGRANENEIRISTKLEGDQVVVEVADTGIGMSEEVQQKLFTPFFTTKPVGVGTGLGLSICYRIVADMGGTISVTSAPGRGSLFRISLPATGGESATKAEVFRGPSVQRGSYRVLVVDDEPIIGKALKRTIGKRHEVAALSSAREALELALEVPFDVILCDMMMPEMNGMEFYRELIRSRPVMSTKVIFLSGGAFTPESVAFLEQHAALKVDKPYDIDALLALIDQVGAAGPTA